MAEAHQAPTQTQDVTSAEWLLLGVGLGQLSAWTMLLLYLHRDRRHPDTGSRIGGPRPPKD